MSNLDPGRQHDLYFLQQKLADPNTSAKERAKIENASHAIRDQSRFASIAKLRRHYDEAMRQNDKAKVERLTREMQKVDRDYQ